MSHHPASHHRTSRPKKENIPQTTIEPRQPLNNYQRAEPPTAICHVAAAPETASTAVVCVAGRAVVNSILECRRLPPLAAALSPEKVATVTGKKFWSPEKIVSLPEIISIAGVVCFIF